MGRISTGISQIGGKFRLLREIQARIPYHEFYLEPFLGSAIVLLNKPRCRYECGNDLNSELINYLLVIREYPKEFDELKQGVFGLVSQEICNRIVRGELIPRNNIERAYFYYYLNKLTFGGGIWMVRKEPPYKGIDPTDQAGKFEVDSTKGYGYMIDNHNLSREVCGRVDSKVVEHAKEEYEIKTKGFGGLVNPRAIPQTTLHEKDFDKVKAQYSGMLNNFALGTIKEKQVEEAKSNFRDVVPKNAQFGGILLSGTGRSGNTPGRTTSIGKAKERYKQAQNKGINPKTTRPYTNNDCGLLSPLNPEAIKRLRYVNLTTYPFQKVYNMFYEAFHKRKGLGEECLLYIDRPYPGTEKYYKSGFGEEEHKILNNIVLESPFHILESLGGECEWIIDIYKESGFKTEEVYTKYSTDATSQKKSKEFLIMNYDITKLPLMQFASEQTVMEDWL